MDINDTIEFPDEMARAALPISQLDVGPPRTFWGDAWYKFYKRKLAVAGLIILIFIVSCTITGPFFYRVPYSEIDFSRSLVSPSLEHPFGTNDLGQDMLARVLYGGRLSISVGIFAMLVAIILGTFIGALSGFFGGYVDTLLMRGTDVFLSLPVLPLLLVVIYLFRDPIKNVVGPENGIFVLIVTMIGLLTWMSVARLVRASVLSVREKEFVTAAFIFLFIEDVT